LIIGGLFVLPTAIFELVNGFIYATLFDGEIYGLFIGLFFYLFFTAISGTLTYMFSKWVFGKKLKEVIIETNDKMKTLNYILIHQGFKAMFLIRLSPLLPSAMFNYLMGGFDSKYNFIICEKIKNFNNLSFYLLLLFIIFFYNKNLLLIKI